MNKEEVSKALMREINTKVTGLQEELHYANKSRNLLHVIDELPDLENIVYFFCSGEYLWLQQVNNKDVTAKNIALMHKAGWETNPIHDGVNRDEGVFPYTGFIKPGQTYEVLICLVPDEDYYAMTKIFGEKL